LTAETANTRSVVFVVPDCNNKNNRERKREERKNEKNLVVEKNVILRALYSSRGPKKSTVPT